MEAPLYVPSPKRVAKVVKVKRAKGRSGYHSSPTGIRHRHEGSEVSDRNSVLLGSYNQSRDPRL